MAKIKNSGTTNAGKDVEESDYTYVADGNVKCYGHSGQQSFLSSLPQKSCSVTLCFRQIFFFKYCFKGIKSSLPDDCLIPVLWTFREARSKGLPLPSQFFGFQVYGHLEKQGSDQRGNSAQLSFPDD